MMRRLVLTAGVFAGCVLSAGCGEDPRIREAQSAQKVSEDALREVRRRAEDARAENVRAVSTVQAAEALFKAAALERDNLKRELAQLESDLSRKDVQAAELAVRVRELEAALPRESSKTQNAEAVDRTLRADLAKAIQERDKAVRDVEKVRLAVAQRDADIARLNATLKDAGTKLKTAGTDSRADDRKLKDAQDRARDLTAQTDDLEKRLQTANGRAKRAEDQNDDIEKRADNLEKENRRLRKRLTDAGLRP